MSLAEGFHEIFYTGNHTLFSKLLWTWPWMFSLKLVSFQICWNMVNLTLYVDSEVHEFADVSVVFVLHISCIDMVECIVFGYNSVSDELLCKHELSGQIAKCSCRSTWPLICLVCMMDCRVRFITLGVQ